jgi:hypothetical protein
VHVIQSMVAVRCLVAVIAVASTLLPAFGAPAHAAMAPRIIHVDPVRGNDARSGVTPALAKRTVTAAWNSIPKSRTLIRGVVIRLAPGRYAPSQTPNYWESRWGSAGAKIVIESRTRRAGSVELPSINMFDVRHLTFRNVQVRSRFIPLHCEQCRNFEVRDSVLTGDGNLDRFTAPQETIKVNQSTDVRLLGNDISGATDNAVDFVAVQRGRIAGNRIHRSRDWCAYVKGGSASIVVESNHVHDCGTGGITAGQGTGLEFMTAPWLRYEAYDIAVRNNVIHDVEGAGVGVNGGYDVLVAHNSMQRVGERDHGIEVVFGERSCDGNAAACAERVAAGGWGPSAPGGDPVYIGNRGVRIANNLLYDAAPYRSPWTHFAIYEPRPLPTGGTGPNPAVADDELRITGNVIWNGPADLALGIGEDGQGCRASNPTCSPDQVRRDNAINTTEPAVIDVLGAPAPGAALRAARAAVIPSFTWDDVTVPNGTVDDLVRVDRDGRSRATTNPVGAYIGAPVTQRLRIVRTGSDLGQVEVRAAGHDTALQRCAGASCSVRALRGDWVELVAVAPSGSRFLRWRGACSGAVGDRCLVRVGTPMPVATAVFGRAISLEP